jgi:hypothetical protein
MESLTRILLLWGSVQTKEASINRTLARPYRTEIRNKEQGKPIVSSWLLVARVDEKRVNDLPLASVSRWRGALSTRARSRPRIVAERGIESSFGRS